MTTTQPGGFSIWSPATELLKSEYGNVTYLVWCQREAHRVGKMGRKLHIWTNGSNVCLHKKQQVK